MDPGFHIVCISSANVVFLLPAMLYRVHVFVLFMNVFEMCDVFLGAHKLLLFILMLGMVFVLLDSTLHEDWILMAGIALKCLI